MLTCVNIALEMIATLICVNHLFCKKYYFSIHDAVFILSEIIIIESANYLSCQRGWRFLDILAFIFMSWLNLNVQSVGQMLI